MKKLFYIFSAIILCLSLCSCSGSEQPVTLPEISGAAAAPQTGQPAAVPTIPTEPGDGLEGGYFNDYLDLLLIIDGQGGYEISGSESHSGSYSLNGDGIVFNISGTAYHATRDSDGDILFDSLTGYFLSDWDKWGISGEEIAAVH